VGFRNLKLEGFATNLSRPDRLSARRRTKLIIFPLCMCVDWKHRWILSGDADSDTALSYTNARNQLTGASLRDGPVGWRARVCCGKPDPAWM